MKDAEKVFAAVEQVIRYERMTITLVPDGWAVFINDQICGEPRATLYEAIAEVLQDYRLDANNSLIVHAEETRERAQKEAEALKNRLEVFEAALA